MRIHFYCFACIWCVWYGKTCMHSLFAGCWQMNVALSHFVEWKWTICWVCEHIFYGKNATCVCWCFCISQILNFNGHVSCEGADLYGKQNQRSYISCFRFRIHARLCMWKWFFCYMFWLLLLLLLCFYFFINFGYLIAYQIQCEILNNWRPLPSARIVLCQSIRYCFGGDVDF